jgi:hypothetical protein
MTETEEFDLTVWCKEVGISDGGAKKLAAAEVRDDLAICLLESEDSAAIKLAPGDSAKFRFGQQILRKKLDKPPPLEDQQETPVKSPSLTPNSAGLYTLEQVSAFLAGKGEVPSTTLKPDQSQSGVLPPPSRREKPAPAIASRRAPEEDHPESLEFGRHLLKDLLTVDDCFSNAAGEKPMLPVNFIRNPKGTITDLDEQVVTEEGRLVVRPNVRKPTADQLTAGQWVAANAIILAKLFPRLSKQELCDYLDYERKIGGLMQLYTHATVFILDNEHRIDVHRFNDRWNDIDPMLIGALLKKKDENQLPPNVHTAPRRDGGGRSNRQGGNRADGRKNAPCWQYNSPEGCPFGQNCRYGHFDGSSGPAARPTTPQYSERAPRFQSGAGNQGNAS